MIDINKLLAAIDEKAPVGSDLRADSSIDSLYYQIKDARNEARDIERQEAMGNISDEKPRWDIVAKLCIEALETKTKDIEIAAWLTEAIVRREGLAGLAAGFSLLKGLVARYWETLYPLPNEEDGLEMRLAPLVSLNGEDYEGTLIQPIRQIAITAGSSQGPFALWQYQQAIENSKLTDNALIAKRREQGGIFMDQIQIAVQESGAVFYEQLQQDVQQASSEFNQLCELLETHCGHDAPPYSRISQAIEEFETHIRFILKEAPFTVVKNKSSDVAKEAEVKPATTEEPKMSKSATPTAMNAAINSRNEALKLLGEIADFFTQTEPQSPLPFLLERAQRLGKMSFPELLKELVNDDSARNAAYELMGFADGSSKD